MDTTQYTFETFKQCPSNIDARNLARGWDTSVGLLGLVIYGPHGSGKTRLAYTIGNNITRLFQLPWTYIHKQLPDDITHLHDYENMPLIILDCVLDMLTTKRDLVRMTSLIKDRVRVPYEGHFVLTTRYTPDQLQHALCAIDHDIGMDLFTVLQQATA